MSEDSTKGERVSLFSKTVTFYLLDFSSFCDYSVYQLQGSFEHWRDRKENCTLLSNSKTELWTDFKIELFFVKIICTLTGDTEQICQPGQWTNSMLPQWVLQGTNFFFVSFIWNLKALLNKKECCNGEMKANMNIYSKWWGHLVQEVAEFSGSQAAGSLHSHVSLSNGAL